MFPVQGSSEAPPGLNTRYHGDPGHGRDQAAFNHCTPFSVLEVSLQRFTFSKRLLELSIFSLESDADPLPAKIYTAYCVLLVGAHAGLGQVYVKSNN